MLPAKSPCGIQLGINKSETQPIGLAAFFWVRGSYMTPYECGKDRYIPTATAPTSLNFAIANPPKTRDDIFTVWQE
jgi:hypothetical protein